jgi:hypothetical protein
MKSTSYEAPHYADAVYIGTKMKKERPAFTLILTLITFPDRGYKFPFE